MPFMSDHSPQMPRVRDAAAAVRAKSALTPRVALVLGSGLGGFADTLDDRDVVPYGEIPSMPVSKVVGHAGNLVLGRASGTPVVVLAVLAGLALSIAVVASLRAPEPVSDRGGVLVEESAEQARAAAVRAIVPVLSYDYRRLDEDVEAARSYMTSAYQDDKYDPLFSLIEDNAPETQTVVGAQVVDSAVVRTGRDRVDVLLFVDRPTTNKQVSDPIVYKDQVTVTMARVDGQWLVDGLQTSPIQE